MIAIALASCAAMATILGGLLALRYKNKIHSILGFTAGVLLAVVAFDILPEVVHLANKNNMSIQKPMIALVIGFLVFHIMEKLLLIHHAQDENCVEDTHPTIGVLSALALSAHSFMDGVGIGLSFQASTNTGMLVAIAVISHDMSDGINTASLMMLHRNSWGKTLMLIFCDAAAPVLGVVSTLFFTLPEHTLLIYLGFFAGFLLCIGASEILPQAHSHQPSFKSIVMTLLGVTFIYLITRIL